MWLIGGPLGALASCPANRRANLANRLVSVASRLVSVASWLVSLPGPLTSLPGPLASELDPRPVTCRLRADLR